MSFACLYVQESDMKSLLQTAVKVKFAKQWNRVHVKLQSGAWLTLVCKDLQDMIHLISDLYQAGLVNKEKAAKQTLRILHQALAEAENCSQN